MNITIIGGGIGGLSLAVALQRKGMQATVYEQAPSLKPVGAGILLASNALQAYAQLGLIDSLKAVGHPVHALNITTPDLTPLVTQDLRAVAQTTGQPTLVIHRATLQAQLLDSLSPESLQLDQQLQSLSSVEAPVLEFAGGHTVHAEAVVGADGLRSRVREALFPKASIAKAWQLCWRGVVDYPLPENYHHALNEAWGPKKRMGFVPLSADKVYWYAVHSHYVEFDQVPLEDLAGSFREFHPLVSELISQTPSESIHVDEILGLRPMRKWGKGKVCLMGDAAHAVPPNLGQGACQAIEDAYVLAECLERWPVEDAFRRYPNLRMPKANKVFRRSWQTGHFGHWGNPTAIALRNWLMRSLPAFSRPKRLAWMYELDRVGG